MSPAFGLVAGLVAMLGEVGRSDTGFPLLWNWSGWHRKEASLTPLLGPCVPRDSFPKLPSVAILDRERQIPVRVALIDPFGHRRRSFPRAQTIQAAVFTPLAGGTDRRENFSEVTRLKIDESHDAYPAPPIERRFTGDAWAGAECSSGGRWHKDGAFGSRPTARWQHH